MALDQAWGVSNVHEKPSCSCLLMELAGWLVSYHPRPTKIHGGPALFGPLFFPTQDEKSAWADHRGLPRWCSSLSSAEFRSLGWDFFPRNLCFDYQTLAGDDVVCCWSPLLRGKLCFFGGDPDKQQRNYWVCKWGGTCFMFCFWILKTIKPYSS